MADLARLYEAIHPHIMIISGIIYGGAWWVWADAVVYSASQPGGKHFDAVTLLPGLGATLALLTMSCVSRDDMDSDSGDEAACRSKTVLFVSYLLSLAAICGAVTLLVIQQQQHADLWISVCTIIQSVLIVTSGVLTWFFRGGEGPDGYSYIA